MRDGDHTTTPSTTLPWSTILPLFGVVVAVLYTLTAGKSVFYCFDPRAIGDALLDGRIPYRDFAMEYPPGMAPLFVIPSLVFSTDGGHRVGFRLLMVATWVALVWLVARHEPRARTTLLLHSTVFAWLWVVSPDIVVALFVSLAFIAARRDRVVGSAFSNAAGGLVKIVPLGLSVLTLRAAPRGRRAAVATIAVAAGIGTLLVPAALANPAAPDYGLRDPNCVVDDAPVTSQAADRQSDPTAYHANRAIHAESTVGTLIVLSRVLRGAPDGTVVEHKAVGVGETGRAELALSLFALAAVAVPLALRGDPRSPATWAALLLAVPALGPIASPQFFLWPLGLVPLLPGRVRALYAGIGLMLFGYFMLPPELIRANGTVLPWLWLLGRQVLGLGAVALLAREATVSHREPASLEASR